MRKGDIMSRKSPFKIILTIEEREYLNTLTRKYTAPYNEVTYCQSIHKMQVSKKEICCI